MLGLELCASAPAAQLHLIDACRAHSLRAALAGHSRGGALAEFATLDIVSNATELGISNPKSTVKLFTMGAPRAGSDAFVKYLQSKITVSEPLGAFSGC